MFDRIWDVLHSQSRSPEDGRFKFWVRKNFTLADVNKAAVLDPGALSNMLPGTQTIVLHKGLLVALQEQLYELLCYAHGTANHGGRDRTLAALRKYYTWVPREIVAQFTMSCPTCMMKKAGLSKTSLASTNGVRNPNESRLPALRDFLSSVAAQEGYSLTDDKTRNLGLKNDRESTFMPLYNHAVDLGSTSAQGSSSISPRSLPMSREVSLYHGLPNGWQFHTDYPTAHAEFTRRKNEGTLNLPDRVLGRKRPRIPSVAPLIGPDYVPHHDDASEYPGTLPSMMRHPACGRSSNDPEVLSPGLQSFLGHSLPPLAIDPVLLAMASPSNDSSIHFPQSHSRVPRSLSPNQGQEHDDNDIVQSSVDVKERRAPAPPALNLSSLTSLDAIEAFLAHRNQRNMSMSLQSQAPLDSATSSHSSCSSQLSAFPVMTTSCSSAVTSALPTPVDDDGKDGSFGGKDGEMGKDEMEETELVSSVSGISMQAVCHEVI